MEDWSSEDFETGLHYLATHEEEAQASGVLDTRQGVTVILPRGLPAQGLTFHGIFMIAPIVVFASVLIGFLGIGVVENWGINSITLSLAVLSVTLLWGLGNALKFLLGNRELFPRRHFVTLGSKGIAMHFARFQLPAGSPCATIPWEDVRGVNRGSPCLFLPATFWGITAAETFVVEGREEKVIIPFHLPEEEFSAHAGAIKKAIKTKMVV